MPTHLLVRGVYQNIIVRFSGTKNGHLNERRRRRRHRRSRSRRRRRVIRYVRTRTRVYKCI